jgi:hypothetical protein
VAEDQEHGFRQDVTTPPRRREADRSSVQSSRWGRPQYDEAHIQQLVRRAWDEAQPIDMGHLGEHNRVLVCKAVVDLIEAISPA